MLILNIPSIIVACNDPGGTMAIIPIIHRLRSDKNINTLVFGGKHAQKIFKNKSISYKKISSYGSSRITRGLIDSILSIEAPILVLTSTSFGKSIDNAFFDRAIAKNIKTFVLIDQWGNYSMRFSKFNENKNFKYLPDYIGLMDEFAKKEMIEEGFPEERLIIIGHPFLDSLIKEDVSIHERKLFCDSLNIKSDGILIVFASEPFKAKDLERIGYTDTIILQYLAKCLKEISEETKQYINLVIKIHPRDDRNTESFSCNVKSKYLNTTITKNGDASQFIQNADIVTGMSSIFLVQSFLLNKPTINIQIGRKSKDELITNKLCLTKAITSSDELLKALRHLIMNKNYLHVYHNQNIMKMDGKATDRAIMFIENILQGQSPT